MSKTTKLNEDFSDAIRGKSKDVIDLLKENKRLREENEMTENQWRMKVGLDFLDEIDRLKALLAKAEGALEFYGEMINHNHSAQWYLKMEKDRGTKARETLAKIRSRNEKAR